MVTKVKVTGLQELQRDLRATAEGLDGDDLSRVMGDIADDTARLAASFAPRRTGRLAASVKGGQIKTKAVVGASVPYAAPINYGWPRRGVAASRFMQRADEAMKPTLPTRLEQAINRLISARGLS
ncbi:HK97 gp10 family phage protein [Dactylosporangium siamense]|uniref:HK97 gp10 family phage protein n=1 Tax=Dactylosporangium siamense TaxID=685454 RepID=A0A919U8P5_9ACTN|nr:HK97 gp10 family phage protein [Dactylosporangium siamense]GIG42985.1 hypothetical protein Dsi01nite_010260 [Dactylosporangium siamense]